VEPATIPTELVIAHPHSERETHYQIVGILGEGGSGTTYRAQIVGTERVVALKQLSLAQMDEWKAIELFEREAQILAQLDRPAIPKYIDYFTIDTPTDRNFYIAQELAPGKTLSDLSASGWRCTEAEVRDIAAQILAILSYLHSFAPPVIHRDLKPSNILRTEAGQISLVDFGAVRQAYHDTFMRGSTVVGTFGYMAPEQFRSQAVPATDLYGLGATLLALLTNRSPAELTQSNLKLSFRDKIQVSPAFADWLEKMLEPDPADRFDSATTALTALKNPKSLASKLPWRKFAAVGFAAAIGLGTIDYYKYYFLNLWGFAPVEAFTAIWQYRDVNKVKSLLDRGVNPNAKDASGSTLIHYAVTNNQVKIAKLLIEKGADVNAVYGADEHTILHLAVLHQDGQITKELLNGKADPNSRDLYEYTPLHAAILMTDKVGYNSSYYGLQQAKSKSPSILSIKHLLEYKADVNAVGGVNVNEWNYPYKGTSLTIIGKIDTQNSTHYEDLLNISKMIQEQGGKYSNCDLNNQACELYKQEYKQDYNSPNNLPEIKVTRTGKHQFKVEKLK
jgi:tRNA A-37 threonylcarbamoyl transferase component Bud32